MLINKSFEEKLQQLVFQHQQRVELKENKINQLIAENQQKIEVSKSDHSRCDDLNLFISKLEEKNRQLSISLDNARLEIMNLHDKLKVYKFKVLELKDKFNVSESDDENFIHQLIKNKNPKSIATDVRGLEDYIEGLPIYAYIENQNFDCLLNDENYTKSDEEIEMLKLINHPVYQQKLEFYERIQFNLPLDAQVQTDQKEMKEFTTQIENGREMQKPQRPRAKSFEKICYNKLEEFKTDAKKELVDSDSDNERIISKIVRIRRSKSLDFLSPDLK